MKAHIEEASGGGNQLARSSAELSTRKSGGKLKLKTVLVPIDFSHLSLRAIPWAQSLAHSSGATVHLVHVHGYEYPVPAGVMPPGMTSTKKVENRLLHCLRDVAANHRLLASVNRCHVRTGIPFDEICNVAREIGADLIVTSTHGRTGWKRLFLGSTAERVVRHTPCPVLIARQSPGSRPAAPAVRTIVVPVDFSRASAKGLAFAVKLAAEFNAALTQLHFISRESYVTPEGAVVYGNAELLREARAAAKERMLATIKATDFCGVGVRSVIRVGDPETQICRFAEKNAIDLIVTTTHGRTGLRHVLLGSVAEHIVRYAKGAVLVVPTRRGAKA